MSRSPQDLATTLYVHVPFCVVKCGYCDFNSFRPEDESSMDRFLDGLAQELAGVAVPRQPPSVFLGGGTPSYLDPERLERLFGVLCGVTDLAGCREVTMEANPESLDRERAEIARAAGVNRLSIGAQSFQPERLRFLDRAHGPDEIRRAVQAGRDAGFDNLSLDLMFGMPGQTLPEWQADLEAALELGPDHISCYHLTFEQGTRLTRDLHQGRVQANDEGEDREMFLWTRERLQEAGFAAYEVSNFAGRGGPCAHNEHYWQQGDYLGVGPGAASHRRGWRSTNLKPLNAWLDAVGKGLRPSGESEVLSLRQRAAETLWLGLRRHCGVDLGAASQRLGLDLRRRFAATIDQGIANGQVQESDGHLRLTPDGLLFADRFAEALFAQE